MTKPSVKQTTHKTKTTNKRRASLLRRRAEDEPTTSSSSSMTSDSDRSSSRFVGCRGDSPGLSAVAERRGFVSVSEQFPRTAERPGVATPQRSKPLAPPSWGGNTTYKTTHTNKEGVRGRTRAGTPSDTGAGTPSKTVFQTSRFSALAVLSRLARIVRFRSGRVLALQEFSVRLTMRRIYFLPHFPCKDCNSTRRRFRMTRRLPAIFSFLRRTCPSLPLALLSSNSRNRRSWPVSRNFKPRPKSTTASTTFESSSHQTR